MIARFTAIVVALCAITITPRIESDEAPKFTVLAIEYFGSLDKPIYPVVISDSYGGAEWYQNTLIEKGIWDKWNLISLHAVRRPLLRSMIATAESHKGGVQQEPEQRSDPYNGVSVTIVTPQRRKIFLFHVEPAMSLLDELVNLCKDNKSLSSDLLYFQKRVRPWGNWSPPQPVQP